MPFEPTDLLTSWTADPLGLALVGLAAGWYLWQVWRAHRSGLRWPAWRVALYLGFGVGTLAYAVCGPLAVYRGDLFWVGALQVATLAALTPVGLALGDPVTLLRRLHPDHPHWLVRALEGGVARVLMFPVVSTVLAVGTLLAVFYTPVFVDSTRSRLVEAGLDVALLVTGLLFVLPLMTDELLPAWAGPGVRTFLAFADGLFDAIPGILIMTSGVVVAKGYAGFAGASDPLQDTHLGGGALLAVAESVGLPVIAVTFVQWTRSDDREAREVDALLDIEAARRTAAQTTPTTRTAAPEAGTGAGAGAEARAEAGAEASGLWWETDPRFAGRYGPRHE
ncbi:cytochrome c oxidase assembly protein [Monashia sp. NPDC004114]